MTIPRTIWAGRTPRPIARPLSSATALLGASLRTKRCSVGLKTADIAKLLGVPDKVVVGIEYGYIKAERGYVARVVSACESAAPSGLEGWSKVGPTTWKRCDGAVVKKESVGLSRLDYSNPGTTWSACGPDPANTTLMQTIKRKGNFPCPRRWKHPERAMQEVDRLFPLGS